MIQAIQQKSIFQVLTLMKESAHSSHEYLQNVYYETSHQSLNLALAVSETFLERKGITRIHGGGFEGCIQVILPLDEVNKYCENMQKIFPQKSTYLFDVRAKGACLIL